MAIDDIQVYVLSVVDPRKKGETGKEPCVEVFATAALARARLEQWVNHETSRRTQMGIQCVVHGLQAQRDGYEDPTDVLRVSIFETTTEDLKRVLTYFIRRYPLQGFGGPLGLLAAQAE